MRYILKFGGSSLSSVQKIEKVAKFIGYFQKTKADELVVVVSAMGETTNSLLSLAKKANKNLPKEKLPELVCLGEKICAGVLALTLEKHGIQSKILPAEKIKIHTKGDRTNSIITHVDTNKILECFSKNEVVIVPGFQGVNENDEICMLGRGGSDQTAIALSCALDSRVVIYTDVKGFFSSNPIEVQKTKFLQTLNTLSAIELASSGAKIMEQKSLEIAHANKKDFVVQKSMKEGGTLISHEIRNQLFESISFKNNLLFIQSQSEEFPQFVEKISKKQAKNLYFCENNSKKFEAIMENLSKEDLKALQNLKKTKKIPCELVTITGCGFTNFSNLKSYLQKTFKKHNIFTFKLSILPTTIKIITKENQALCLTKILHKHFSKEI